MAPQSERLQAAAAAPWPAQLGCDSCVFFLFCSTCSRSFLSLDPTCVL